MNNEKRTMMKYRDIIVGLLLMGFSVFMYFETFDIKVLHAAKGSLGPAMTPRIIFIAIFILSFIIMIGGVVQLKKNTELPPPEERKRPFIVLLSMILFALLLKSVGFIIVTPIYIFTQILLLMPREKWNYRLYIIVSIVGTIFIFIVFRNILKVSLPMGILG